MWLTLPIPANSIFLQHNPESFRCLAKRDTQQELQTTASVPPSNIPSQASGVAKPASIDPITGAAPKVSSSRSSSTSSSSSGPWPASAWPRGVISPVCRECGGRRVIASAAGPLPCPSCISWQRPDYKRDEPLLTVKDLNLNSLEDLKITNGTNFDGTAKSSRSDDELVRTASTKFDSENSTSTDDESDDGLSSTGRRGGQMTEQKRLAIKLAMQSRGPLATDHKRRISNAMRERYASNPSMRQVGRPKKCSHCGELGHNRKKCPQLIKAIGLDNRVGKEEQLDEIIGKLDPRDRKSASNKRMCGVCGQLGHNKRSCPEFAARQAMSSSQKSAKVIIIEEEEEEEKIDELEEQLNAKVEVKEKKQQLPLAGNAMNNSSTTTVSVPSSQEMLIKGSMNGEVSDNDETEKTAVQTNNAPQKAAPRFTSGPSSVARRPSTSSEKTMNMAPQILPPQVLRTLPGSDLALTEDGALVFPLPSNPEQCVAQAEGAVLRAWGDGIRRQSLELLLPQSGQDAGDAWPGGIRQQFRAALPMLESLLLRLKRAEGLEGRITAEWLDEGDCVGAWQSERLAAVVFPTADTLPSVRRIDDALSGKRLVLVVNSQWQPQGQIVSDFGFGRSRRSAERYIASLEEVYYLRRIRVLGDEVRVLRCYPAQWQVHYVRSAGETELVAVEQEKPTYQRLLELLQGVRDSRASKSWLDRALDKRFYDDIGAYSEGSPRDEEEGIIRDIITGEIIGRRNNIKMNNDTDFN